MVSGEVWGLCFVWFPFSLSISREKLSPGAGTESSWVPA